MSKDKYRPSTADFEVVDTLDGYVFVQTGPGTGGRPNATPGYGGEGYEDYEAGIRGPHLNKNWYPKNLRVAEQKVYYHTDGRLRINVTFEWDELSEAENYMVRVSPASDDEV